MDFQKDLFAIVNIYLKYIRKQFVAYQTSYFMDISLSDETEEIKE